MGSSNTLLHTTGSTQSHLVTYYRHPKVVERISSETAPKEAEGAVFSRTTIRATREQTNDGRAAACN